MKYRTICQIFYHKGGPFLIQGGQHLRQPLNMVETKKTKTWNQHDKKNTKTGGISLMRNVGYTGSPLQCSVPSLALPVLDPPCQALPTGPLVGPQVGGTGVHQATGTAPEQIWIGQMDDLFLAQLDKTCHSAFMLALKCGLLSEYLKVVIESKNPAYGRHQLSRPMRIIGPIQI